MADAFGDERTGDAGGATGRTGLTMPSIDPGARQRLSARFGPDVAAWFDALPSVLRRSRRLMPDTCLP
jgi:hypothetical protein